MPRSVARSLGAFAVVFSLALPDAALAADPKDIKVKGQGAKRESVADDASDPAPEGLKVGPKGDAKADDKAVDIADTMRGVPRAWIANTSMFSIRRRPEKARSAFWFPMICFFAPGFDQWWEGQFLPAAAYTGTAAAGYGYADYVQSNYGVYEKNRLRRKYAANDEPVPDELENDDALNSKSPVTRKIGLASQVAQWAGGMSTYHSFRTAVRTRKQYGEYSFLNYEETPFDIMTAPFHAEYLLRPTTFIPLAVISGLSILSMNQPESADTDLVKDQLRAEDAFYAGAFSYNAGTHEEAVFRGWLQPWLMQQWGSPFWSNATQSVVFGAAHLNTNPLPIIQILLGYHLGWVTQKNGYRLGEAVFIHAWWDVVAFITSYSYREKTKDEKNKDKSRLVRPMLMLPPLEYAF